MNYFGDVMFGNVTLRNKRNEYTTRRRRISRTIATGVVTFTEPWPAPVYGGC